ncbi:MAG: glycine cleavage system aminomethyltransferase GcvT [Bacteroidetes bacterium]|nr:MAG: glycine cleavage system aminomethyltransferase GcvT [Bacteroidota bacterium]
MKKIPLSDLHESLGAKMTEFGGFLMPVRYSSDKDEHLAVRNSVGVFDVSHMGEFTFKGKNALALLQKICSNDIAALPIGKAQYNYFPNENGGVVDDLIVYKKAEDDFLMVVNASNIDKDWAWVNRWNEFFKADIANISEEICLFAVQGPNAVASLQKLTDTDLAEMPYYAIAHINFAGIENITVASTGYTKKGSGSFEVFVPKQHAESVWKQIFEAGKEFEIKPIGLGARDTLRMEMGYCLYGNELSDTISPLEAGLGWVTKFTKEFINHENLKKQKEEGIKQKLIAFKVLENGGIPRSHYEIVDANGEKIGEVTSGTLSPVLNIGVGLGYVPLAFATIGTEIFIKIRQKNWKAEVVKLPFV